MMAKIDWRGRTEAEEDVARLQRAAKLAAMPGPSRKTKEARRRREAAMRLLFFTMSAPNLVDQLKTITQEKVAILTPDQRVKLQGWVDDLGREQTRLRSLMGVAIKMELIEKGD